jgi:hypothetical protein
MVALAQGGDLGPHVSETNPMSALSKTLCALLLSFGFAGSAVAAQTTSPAPGSTADQNAQPAPPAHITQRLRNDLSKAGFTDIKIMPSSFLVRAKDSEGNPVMMVINPDSMTEVTERPVSGTMKGDTTGSSSGAAANSPTPPAKQ